MSVAWRAAAVGSRTAPTSSSADNASMRKWARRRWAGVMCGRSTGSSSVKSIVDEDSIVSWSGPWELTDTLDSVIDDVTTVDRDSPRASERSDERDPELLLSAPGSPCAEVIRKAGRLGNPGKSVCGPRGEGSPKDSKISSPHSLAGNGCIFTWSLMWFVFVSITVCSCASNDGERRLR